MNCLASPVYDFRGKVVVAIGISGPAGRISNNDIKKLAGIVKQCARRLSAELGGMGAFGRWNVGNWCDEVQALRHKIGL